MYKQVLDPVGDSLFLSALVALLPLITLFVLLGGLKTVQEGRNEFGPPFLSKIPYLNRLFKNVGIGRETKHIMIMVTPRIIISSEEELAQAPQQ